LPVGERRRPRSAPRQCWQRQEEIMMFDNPIFAFCIATSEPQAERIARRLKVAGFPGSDVSVLLPANARTSEFAERAATGDVGDGLHWLVGIGTHGIPGTGFLVAAGPIMAALAGAAAVLMTGAAAVRTASRGVARALVSL